jgi:hypothetical protein
LEQKEALIEKLKKLGLDADANGEQTKKGLKELEKDFTPEELQILDTPRGRRMMRAEDSLNIDNFTRDSTDGMTPRLEQGKLGLANARRAEIKYTRLDSLSFLDGEARVREKVVQEQGQMAAEAMNGSYAMNGRTEANGVKHTNGVNGRISGHGMMSNASSTTNGSAVGGLLAPLNGTGASLDEASRHTLVSALHGAAENLETLYDAMLRYANAVSFRVATVTYTH